MKRFFSKRKILNLLALAVMLNGPINSGITGACAFLFYEPKKPEMLEKVTREELLSSKK